MKTQTETTVVPFAVKSTVPLKHRSSCPSAKGLYAQIMSTEDFTPIIHSMIADGVCKTESRAQDLINAFLQWFCAGAVNVTKSYVMFVGPVDRAFHMMVLNTKWYFAFCYNHTGVYTHHDPVDQAMLDFIEQSGAIQSTIEIMCTVWGDDLHPELKKLVRAFKQGILVPAMVSCTGNDGPFDIVPRDNF